MKSIKSKLSVFKTLGMIVVLSVLVLPLAPLTALAVSDVTAPSVVITAPVTGATVSGVVAVSANATDLAIPASDCIVTIFGTLYDVTPLQGPHSGGNVFVCGTNMTTVYQGMHGTNVSRMTPYVIPQSGISKVELWVDGVLNSSDTSSPYAFSWNSATVSNGSHTLVAKAFDLANNQTSSVAVTVTTNNAVTNPSADTVAPVVSITSPASAASLSGSVNVVASATDSVGVTKVEWYLDGVLKNSTTTTPYTFVWNTTTATNGSHSLSAKAYDSAGNVGTSTVVTVSVQNGTVVTPPKHHDDEKEHGNKHEDKHEKKDKKDKKEHKKELKNKNSHDDEDDENENDNDDDDAGGVVSPA